MMTDGCTLTAQHTVLAMPIGELTVVREGDLLEHAKVTRVLAPTLW
jgi:hypothetical protein